MLQARPFLILGPAFIVIAFVTGDSAVVVTGLLFLVLGIALALRKTH
ncbi:MAG: hypothetical protein ACRDZW_09885 [Acidimicrobiales bacterium]